MASLEINEPLKTSKMDAFEERIRKCAHDMEKVRSYYLKECSEYMDKNLNRFMTREKCNKMRWDKMKLDRHVGMHDHVFRHVDMRQRRQEKQREKRIFLAIGFWVRSLETWDDGAQRLLTLKISLRRLGGQPAVGASAQCGFDRLALLVHRGAIYRSTGVNSTYHCVNHYQISFTLLAVMFLFIIINLDHSNSHLSVISCLWLFKGSLTNTDKCIHNFPL